MLTCCFFTVSAHQALRCTQTEYNFQFVCGTTAYEVNAKLILDGSRLLGQLEPKLGKHISSWRTGLLVK